MAEIDAIIAKYRSELKEQLSDDDNPIIRNRVFSQDYQEFKKQYLPRSFTFYEKVCGSCAFLNLSPDPKARESLENDIRTSHLDVTPEGVYGAAIIIPFIASALLFAITYAIFLTFDMFIFLMILVIFATLVWVMIKIPTNAATSIRLKASNQMVQSVFYVVSYMRHTSNLELAVEFASDRIAPPLALDFKKVLWDVESGHKESLKEALDEYLETWRPYNLEFVESFHLIEGSLYEPTEDRRIGMLEKSLRVMLDETYEKMLHFAHDLKGPINMLYMLGIILPILSLVILPLIGSMMTGEDLTPARLSFAIFLLYNIVLPLVVYSQGRQILGNRPTGYGNADISEENPTLRKLKNINVLGLSINPIIFSIIIVGFGLFVGVLPLLIQVGMDPTDVTSVEGLIGSGGPDLSLMPENPNSDFRFWGYKVKTPEVGDPYIIGPYGTGALALSIVMILLLGVGIGLYFFLRYRGLYEIRERSKSLEKEFSSALFQLGNRLGDGIPAELAFEKAAFTVKGTVAGDFFTTVALNVRRMGMSVRDAIFDPKRGALSYYPAPLIESSMRVLIESSKKGPIIASEALINISEYIREIRRVNERLQDLLADVISDMKQQISALAPAIAGIVVGITAMIMTILTELAKILATFTGDGGEFGGAIGEAGAPAGGQLAILNTLFGDGIPTYFFQLIVGLYILADHGDPDDHPQRHRERFGQALRTLSDRKEPHPRLDPLLPHRSDHFAHVQFRRSAHRSDRSVLSTGSMSAPHERERSHAEPLTCAYHQERHPKNRSSEPLNALNEHREALLLRSMR
jgi:Flp pilus assembly protein TadB